ncbi:DUF6286 domain-containing Asp23/Gls24 family envelope stress response protein [Streptomyces rochei]|uniref:DUF6286 domain-containing Asp23/Gls24 family envelope stress response protein n=1 Tax=Streptomyces rochei TaxID=1928 RepID=UPI00364A150F
MTGAPKRQGTAASGAAVRKASGGAPAPGGSARTVPADRGRTVVAERAVRRIAERAAGEADLVGRHAQVAHGTAAVDGRRADVRVDVRLPYPARLGEAGERVRGRMAERVAELSGLTVRSASVRVQSLAPDRAAPSAPSVDRDRPSGRARRPWSARRVPAALVAVAAAAGCGVLLGDLLAVHLAGRRPAPWRTGVVDWPAAHGPGDGTVVAVGAVAAVLGAWLLWLALTPGLRGVLPMSPVPGHPRQRAVLDRSAVAEFVRDAAAAVPGVTDVRVRCGRRRVRLRARLGFGDRRAAHDAVRAATDTTLTALGLSRPLKLTVALRTEPHWRPPAPPDQRPDESSEPRQGVPGVPETFQGAGSQETPGTPEAPAVPVRRADATKEREQ